MHGNLLNIVMEALFRMIGKGILRVEETDYFGKHLIGQSSVPNTPHIHLEFLSPRSNGNGYDVIKNVHVPLVD